MPVSDRQEILDQYPQPLAATEARFLDQRDPAAQHTRLRARFAARLKYLAAAANDRKSQHLRFCTESRRQ